MIYGLKKSVDLRWLITVQHLLSHDLASFLTVQETNIYLEVLYQNSLSTDVGVLSMNVVKT